MFWVVLVSCEFLPGKRGHKGLANVNSIVMLPEGPGGQQASSLRGVGLENNGLQLGPINGTVINPLLSSTLHLLSQ